MVFKDSSKMKENFEELLLDRNRVIMVIGGSDTGKTTLVESMADLLSRHGITGILDLDMGQSHIGPPSTIAWGRVSGGFKGWDDIEVEDFYFTGTLSPPGNLLPSVVGAKRLLDRALPSCDKLIIDTTGLIGEPVGRVLKQYKIDALSPDIIMALEKEGELEGVLGSFRLQSKPVILRLSVPPGVTLKSPVKRADYRALKFKKYFASSGRFEVSVKDTAVRFTREAARDLTGRLASLRDKDGADLALGMVEGTDGKRIILRTPLKDTVEFATLVIGSAVIAL